MAGAQPRDGLKNEGIGMTGRGLRAWLAMAILVAALAFVVPAQAHDTGTHEDQDTVVSTPAEERELNLQTIQESRELAPATDRAGGGTEGTVGSWGPLLNWPVVGIHSSLLDDGRVLLFDSMGDRSSEYYPVHDTTRAMIWDPKTGEAHRVDTDTGFNIFCAGHAHLWNGSLFIAGGNKNALLEGITKTHTFDTASESWTLGQDMARERWYPSVTPLDNGEMLVTEGSVVTPEVPEVRQLDGSMRTLTTAEGGRLDYPWLDMAPNGQVFYSGPDSTLQMLDTDGTGKWRDLGYREGLGTPIQREFGSRAMFDIGKILVAGGGKAPGGMANSSSVVIDANFNPAVANAGPKVRATDPMSSPRRQHNLTVLADGTVLASGGLSSDAERVDLAHGVMTPELWNPETDRWRTLAPMSVTRQYHSTALLLPDGRVLTAGGGICLDCEAAGYLAKNAQVFSPPYLFKRDGSGQLAERPQIGSSPDSLAFGQSFELNPQAAGEIRKLALVRLGSVTHSVNMEQRYVPLDFTRQGGALEVAAPASAGIAPPGPYMLFAVNAAGVPSEAAMVRMLLPGEGSDPAADMSPPRTRITSGPKRKSSRRKVRLRFNSSEPGSTFECKLDRHGFRPCMSPKWIRVKPGRHRFAVRAVDPAWNRDLSPAIWRFRTSKRR